MTDELRRRSTSPAGSIGCAAGCDDSERRRAARHPAHERPLPDRLHRFRGDAARRPRRARCFVTDGRYRDQSAEQLAAAGVDAEIAIGATRRPRNANGSSRPRRRATRCSALEDHDVTWAQQREFADAFTGCELVPAGTPIEELRRVKDAGESRPDPRRRARSPTTRSPSLRRARNGHHRAASSRSSSSSRCANAARAAMSFDPIIAAGPNGAKPHARAVRPGRSSAASWSCATSVASSTATAPT